MRYSSWAWSVEPCCPEVLKITFGNPPNPGHPEVLFWIRLTRADSVRIEKRWTGENSLHRVQPSGIHAGAKYIQALFLLFDRRQQTSGRTKPRAFHLHPHLSPFPIAQVAELAKIVPQNFFSACNSLGGPLLTTY